MPIFDPKHFCPSWACCCEENLKLKPKHPPISVKISLKEVFEVLKAIEMIWHSHCGKRTATFEECVKAIIMSKEEADIIIKNLSNCNCCTRHTLHKPFNLGDINWKSHVVPFYLVDEHHPHFTAICKCFKNEGIKIDYKCDCVCRNQSRMIQSFFL